MAEGEPDSQEQSGEEDPVDLLLSQSTNLDVVIARAQRQSTIQVPDSQPTGAPLVFAPEPIRPPDILIEDFESHHSRPDPEDPFRSQWQWKMMHAFRVYGRIGLAEVILDEARKRWNDQQAKPKPSENKSWWRIIEDAANGNHYTFALLLLLPDKIICSLIRNTLPFDFFEDRDVRFFVMTRMQKNQDCAGVYVNIFTKTPPPRAGRSYIPPPVGATPGTWLSSDQVITLGRRVWKYRRNAVVDVQENLQVDNQHSRHTNPNIFERRFKLKDEKWDEWMFALGRQYITGIDPSKVDVPFRSCPMEVGWSANIGKRLEAHSSNNGTTSLFGVFNAMSRQGLSDEGFNFPGPWQLVLFPVWERNIELARVAEILGSMLCSSYSWEGGFNHHLAGGSCESANEENDLKPEQKPMWVLSARKALDLWTSLRLDQQELYNAKRGYEPMLCCENIDQLRQDNEDLKRLYHEQRSEIQQVDSERAAAQARQEELDDKIREKRRLILANTTERTERSKEVWAIVDELDEHDAIRQRGSSEMEELHRRRYVVGDMHLSKETKALIARTGLLLDYGDDKEAEEEWRADRLIARLVSLGLEDADELEDEVIEAVLAQLAEEDYWSPGTMQDHAP